MTNIHGRAIQIHMELYIIGNKGAIDVGIDEKERE